ncbi:MAG: hypothetical protein IJA53_10795 [Spirochaetaceae bacterium]|nr:hypothetical protein [Spirochaetaceae bacterium]
MNKKLVSIICLFFTLYIANAEEVYDSDILSILQENSKIVAEETLESSDDSNESIQTENEDITNVLNILQESNEKIAKENEEREKIVKESEKRNRSKKLQDLISSNSVYFTMGLNYPFCLSNSSPIFSKSVGLSVSGIGNYSFFTIKGSFDAINIPYPEIVTSEDDDNTIYSSISIGISPIHSPKLFFGLYGTMGFDEEIGLYQYNSLGGSVTVIRNFVSSFFSEMGFYINIDATYKFKASGPELPNSSPTYLGTWNILPSIGFSLKSFSW